MAARGGAIVTLSASVGRSHGAGDDRRLQGDRGDDALARRGVRTVGCSHQLRSA